MTRHGVSGHTIQLEVRRADILSFEGDGLVVPSISNGLLHTPLAERVRARAGDAVVAEVASHAPIAVGACIVTDAGPLPVKHLVHAPIMEEPGIRVGVENIRRAVRASLLGSTRHEIECLAIPGFGYGENGVACEETARAIIDEIIGYKHGPAPTSVVLIDEDPEMHEAFAAQVGER